MKLSDKYWLTILFTFCRYFSIIMFLSGIAFIIAGCLVNPWYFTGLAAWPLFIMLGIVNLRYIRLLARHYKLVGPHILDDVH